MKVEHLVGNKYWPNSGDGLTVQDLIELLMTIPPKARRNSYVQVAFPQHIAEVIGMGVAQSDQAEPHEIKVYLETL